MSIRLDGEVVARVDAIAAARSTEWRRVTRSEVLRELVSVGLDDVEWSVPRTPRLRLVKENMLHG